MNSGVGMGEQGRADRADRAAWEGEMFRLLAENVVDYAIFVVDPHRHILSWSKGAERLLGFTEEEIVGRQCDCFFTPEDVRAGVPQAELEQALRTGRGDDDRWHLRKDGTRFWASGVVTPLKDEGGRLRGFAKIMRDRTELKRAAAGLDGERAEAELNTEDGLRAVRAEEGEARRIGVEGVPFFVINGGLALSGAQPPETFLAAFDRASDTGPVAGGGGTCTVEPGGKPFC